MSADGVIGVQIKHAQSLTPRHLPQIACRCDVPLEEATISKISMFTHVGKDQVIGVHNCASVYHVPLLLRQQGLLKMLTKRLKLDEIVLSKEYQQKGENLLRRWKELTLT